MTFQIKKMLAVGTLKRIGMESRRACHRLPAGMSGHTKIRGLHIEDGMHSEEVAR